LDFGAETAAHTLRLILSGLFDCFPRLRIILATWGRGFGLFLMSYIRILHNGLFQLGALLEGAGPNARRFVNRPSATEH
jgi:predicted TIM-barrel fold metal-dependent hydrolase